MRTVTITGAAMTPFGRHLDRTTRSLATEAASAALADAGLSVEDLDQVIYGNAAAGVVTGQEMIRGQVALRPLGLGGIPVINVENACASSSSAFHIGWLTVASGAADTVLVVGAEKLTHEDRAVTFGAFNGAVDLETMRERRAQRAASTTRSLDDELTGGGRKSTFMDVYADMAKAYMVRSGATAEDFAAVVVKSRRFGSWNPAAQFRTETSVEEVLAGRTISDPLTLAMCSPIGDGAAALVLQAAGAASVGETVRVRATVVRSGTPERPLAAERAIDAAYAAASVGPEDLDVVELHDAAAPAELIYYEELGLCDPGDGPAYLRRGDADLGGKTPVNTSGGLLSRGHPIGATGAGQLVALYDQLTGRAGPATVEGARIGLAHNAGGTIDGDVGAAVVTILERT